MIIQAIAFYLFAAVAVPRASWWSSARNPVHSVLFLILAFFNAAGLFVLLGAEFLAMILVVVYVGAVAVLFLFVVMMLDIDFAELRAGLPALPADRRADRAGPAGGAGARLRRLGRRAAAIAAAPRAVAGAGQVTNTEALGPLLYTNYVYLFQAAGLVLLVAMIGAIVLTLRHARRRAPPVDRRAGRAAAPKTVEIRKRAEPGAGYLT